MSFSYYEQFPRQVFRFLHHLSTTIKSGTHWQNKDAFYYAKIKQVIIHIIYSTPAQHSFKCIRINLCDASKTKTDLKKIMMRTFFEM